MDRKEITRRTWMYLAEHDEYANIVKDGKITQACELIADLIENLIDNGVLAEPKTNASDLRIHDVSNRRELLCAFFKYFRDNGEANIGMTIEGFVDGFLSTQ
jgi:hypothetical protein